MNDAERILVHLGFIEAKLDALIEALLDDVDTQPGLTLDDDVQAEPRRPEQGLG